MMTSNIILNERTFRLACFLCRMVLVAMFALPASLLPFTGGHDNALAASAVRYTLSNENMVGNLRITKDKSRTVIVSKPFAEVQIGNAEIADVKPLSNTSFYLLGKKIGTTNVTLYSAEKKLLGVIDLEVSFDIPSLRTKLKQNVHGANIKVVSLNGKIMLKGTVPNTPALKRALNIAEQYAPKSVTNALAVDSPQQVMLEVRFIEATRTASRELGIGFGINRSRSTESGNTLVAGLIGTTVPFGSMIGRLLNGGVRADALIDALEQRGLARRLAEPNLTALSGDTASFLAGGEFPFPVGAQNGEIQIEFKKFGVGLTFTPTVLAGGLINLAIEPEVSQLDRANNGIQIAGVVIPSLIVRRAKTTVELRDGQSFAIAGLLQSNNEKARRQLPWIGSVPVLGALFSSSQYQKNETDLVIIITPRLVRPVPPGVRLSSPLDSRIPANDIDFFLGGKMDKRKNPSSYGHILQNNSTYGPVMGKPGRHVKSRPSTRQNFGAEPSAAR